MIPWLFEIFSVPGSNEEGPLNILPMINFWNIQSKNDAKNMACIEIDVPEYSL